MTTGWSPADSMRTSTSAGASRPARTRVMAARNAPTGSLPRAGLSMAGDAPALVAVAERVERGAVHGGGAQPALTADAPRRGDALRGEALLELLGRLVVEGEQQDAAGIHAARHQRGDPAHERLGLARAGGREDARRAAPVLYGGALCGVEPD